MGRTVCGICFCPYGDDGECACMVPENKEKQGPCEAVAARYDFDGYGYQYIDEGSGSDWRTRHKDVELLYTKEHIIRLENEKEELLKELNRLKGIKQIPALLMKENKNS